MEAAEAALSSGMLYLLICFMLALVRKIHRHKTEYAQSCLASNRPTGVLKRHASFGNVRGIWPVQNYWRGLLHNSGCLKLAELL